MDRIEREANDRQKRLEEMEASMNRLVEGLMERDTSVGKDLEEINKRLNRHRFNIDSCHSWEKDVWAKVSLLDDKRMELEAKVMAMEERLCHCGDRSAARSPSPLEYATPDSSVVGMSGPLYPSLPVSWISQDP